MPQSAPATQLLGVKFLRPWVPRYPVWRHRSRRSCRIGVLWARSFPASPGAPHSESHDAGRHGRAGTVHPETEEPRIAEEKIEGSFLIRRGSDEPRLRVNPMPSVLHPGSRRFPGRLSGPDCLRSRRVRLPRPPFGFTPSFLVSPSRSVVRPSSGYRLRRLGSHDQVTIGRIEMRCHQKSSAAQARRHRPAWSGGRGRGGGTK